MNDGGTMARLGELCDVFLPDECKNYFKQAGYKTREKNILNFNTIWILRMRKRFVG